MLDVNKSNLAYFESGSMRELYASMDKWQKVNNRPLLSISVRKDGSSYCCIAITGPTEVVITSPDGKRYVEVNSNSSGLMVSPDAY
jgi:hypothetical protein